MGAWVEADITRVNMADETTGEAAIELRFVIAVRDTSHLDTVLRNLRKRCCVSAKPATKG